MDTMQARFADWVNRFAENLTDMGGQLGAGTLVGEPLTTDGPFVEVREIAGGYMIVTAGTLREAAEVAVDCPGLVRPGSGVEVIEIRNS
jgi:hypothetical protein